MLDFVNKPLTLQGEVKFKIVSLFSGAGGSSLGYIWAGGKVLAAVEWDENAVATYRLNFPDTPILHRDIKTVTVEELLALTHLVPGELDILDGSPPCQGFSTAGKRQIDDPRNSLFQEYVRLLRGLQPKCFVMENVSGMVKGNMKHVFAIAMRELKASGYRVKCQLMNAMYFGVPQSRQRVIFIGVRNDLNIEVSHPKTQSGMHTFREAVDELSLSVQAPEIDHVWVDEVARHTKWISVASQLKQGQKLVPDVPSSIRAWMNKPLPTIQKNAMPGQPPYVRNSTIHPTQPRTLSIREMARCQSMPDAFRFVDALNNGMQRIGNSVPPMFMYHLASHIYTHILQRTSEVSHA
jgi:DNA (cytosine-5)-methyltransferase 1